MVPCPIRSRGGGRGGKEIFKGARHREGEKIERSRIYLKINNLIVKPFMIETFFHPTPPRQQISGGSPSKIFITP